MTRASSCMIRVRTRLALMYSTAGMRRAARKTLGQALLSWRFMASTEPSRVIWSKAAARFGREDDPEPAQIGGGQLDRDQLEALRAHHIEHSGAVDLVDALQFLALLAMVGIGFALISGFKGASDIADAQALRIERRVPVEMARRLIVMSRPSGP